ncbi:hypothetical protein [Arthrobacter sp. R1-13]
MTFSQSVHVVFEYVFVHVCVYLLAVGVGLGLFVDGEADVPP